MNKKHKQRTQPNNKGRKDSDRNFEILNFPSKIRNLIYDKLISDQLNFKINSKKLPSHKLSKPTPT